MPRKIDLTGRRYAHLTVISQHGHIGDKISWLCRCDCGNEKVVSGSNLKTGNTTSCGCYHAEVAKDYHTTHGMSKTKLYTIWSSMRYRCENPKCQRYSSYGGKGVSVCAEWKRFNGFYSWAISARYEDGLSIERIDVDGNYEPSNCKWIPLIDQSQNKTTSRFVSYKSKKLTISQLANLTGMPYQRLYQRINKLGWSTDDAVRSGLI